MKFSQNKSFARNSHKKHLVILLAFRWMSREVIKKAENEIKIINYEIIKTSILDVLFLKMHCQYIYKYFVRRLFVGYFYETGCWRTFDGNKLKLYPQITFTRIHLFLSLTGTTTQKFLLNTLLHNLTSKIRKILKERWLSISESNITIFFGDSGSENLKLIPSHRDLIIIFFLFY